MSYFFPFFLFFFLRSVTCSLFLLTFVFVISLISFSIFSVYLTSIFALLQRFSRRDKSLKALPHIQCDLLQTPACHPRLRPLQHSPLRRWRRRRRREGKRSRREWDESERNRWGGREKRKKMSLCMQGVWMRWRVLPELGHLARWTLNCGVDVMQLPLMVMLLLLELYWVEARSWLRYAQLWMGDLLTRYTVGLDNYVVELYVWPGMI